MKHYPKEFKESVLKRLLPPYNEKVVDVAAATGVSHQTLRNWMQEAHIRELTDKADEDMSRLGSSEKFRIVVETLGMSESELSEYARKAGLYPDQIREWREACQNANDTNNAECSKYRREMRAMDKENRELRREIQKKDRALAEMGALLVLGKKVRAIWGDAEGD